MAIKTFKEMMNLDISDHTDIRDGAEYLPWAKCLMLLHENGAEKVYFEPVSNANGHSLFESDRAFDNQKGDSHRCYEVKVKITIDDMEWTEVYPLMNGIHPVKDNSINQLKISNAHKRAFVKGVAVRTGLGFKLWTKDEDIAPSLEVHNIWKIKQRVEEKLTAGIKKHNSAKEAYAKLGLNESKVSSMLNGYKQLAAFEESLKLL